MITDEHYLILSLY